eukprot:4953103-Pyramimonas_sp.AAC.2
MFLLLYDYCFTDSYFARQSAWTDGRLVGLQELLTGGDILQAIKHSPEATDPQYKEQLVAHFIRSATCTLIDCHDLKICHRDIKPQNFLLAYEGVSAPIKAVDFGFSTIYERHDHVKHGLRGTPHFVPPEAFNGVCTPAGDMWSLGTLKYPYTTTVCIPGAHHSCTDCHCCSRRPV